MNLHLPHGGHPAARRLAHFARFFFQSRILGRDLPLIASVKLSYRCNLACRACPFHRRAGEAGAHMDWDTARTGLDRLADMGCPIVVFEGGEPLLWSDHRRTFGELAGYARKRFACVAATTNGTLCLDVPTDILWVSVDGTRETHNLLRSGSYDTVMENLKTSHHPRLFVHYTISRQNWIDFPAAVRTISALPAVKGITVQLFYPYHLGEEPLQLDPAERREVLGQAIMLKAKGYPILNSAWGLKAMVNNSWICRARLLANVDPDGKISRGCYVKHRGVVVCSQCGFTPVAEASGAYSFIPGPLVAGLRIFLAG